MKVLYSLFLAMAAVASVNAQNPNANPNAGSNPASNPASNPGSNPASNPGSNPASNPGSNPAPAPLPVVGEQSCDVPSLPSPSWYSQANFRCAAIEGVSQLFKIDCPDGGCSGTVPVDGACDIYATLTFSNGGKTVSVTDGPYIVKVKGGTCNEGDYSQAKGQFFQPGSGLQTPCGQKISHVELCIPTGCCDDPEIVDDPHVKTWGGEWFDYQGECDLELMHVPKFDGKVDLDVHVRTTIQYDYSYIEAAALRIGDDILEVTAWGEYAVNGVEDAKVNSYLDTQSHIRTNYKINQIGGYPIYHTMLSKKKHQFDVILGPGQNITLSNHKEFVSVKTHHSGKSKFGGVTGFLGNYEGKMLARDGVTDLSEDPNAFAQEWQVRNDEPMLFRTAREPQFPAQCRLPSQADAEAMEQRRLGEGISEEQAEAACAHLKKNEHEFKACVYDVTATNDLDMAQSGAY